MRLTYNTTFSACVQHGDSTFKYITKFWYYIDWKWKSGCPCLIPGLRRRASNFSLLILTLAVGLWYMAFITLRYIPSVLKLLRISIMKNMLNFSNAFSVCWDNYTILSFILLMWCITFVGLHTLTHSCDLGIHKQKNEIGSSSYITHKN